MHTIHVSYTYPVCSVCVSYTPAYTLSYTHHIPGVYSSHTHHIPTNHLSYTLTTLIIYRIYTKPVPYLYLAYHIPYHIPIIYRSMYPSYTQHMHIIYLPSAHHLFTIYPSHTGHLAAIQLQSSYPAAIQLAELLSSWLELQSSWLVAGPGFLWDKSLLATRSRGWIRRQLWSPGANRAD